METNSSDTKMSYLFSPRLNFLSSKEQLISKCVVSSSQYSLSFLDSRELESQQFIRQLKTDYEILDVYRIFYQLIYHCRFNKKNLQQTFINSRDQIKKRNKKNTKDIQIKRKVRIKRSLQEMGLSQDEYEIWKEVLNHKNIFKHISHAKAILKKIFQLHFQFMEQGIIKFKHQQVQNEVKIMLCILVIDIISLINTMNFMFYPFNSNDTLLNLVIQEEKILFDQANQKLNQDGSFNVVNSLSIQNLFGVIKSLVAQLPTEKNTLKFWYKLEQIRHKYLIQQNGMTKRKLLDQKISQNKIKFQMSQFQQDWQNFHAQYFELRKQPFQQDLSSIFGEFSLLVNHNIDQMIKKNERKQIVQNFVADYLVIIRNIWISINKNSAQKLYVEQISKINPKFSLPQSLLKNESENVLEILNKKVETLSQFKRKDFLQRLKSIRLDLSKKLINLQKDDSLVEDYFIALQKNLINLLKQKSQTDQMFQKIDNYQKNFQLKEFLNIVAKMKSLLQEITKYEDLEINNQKDINLENEIKSLYETYENEQNLIDEIKYFLITVDAFNKVQVDEDKLRNAKEFYSKTRLQILSHQNIVNKQKLSNLTYGLIDFIRILIYELIFKIRLKVKPLQLDDDQKLLFKLVKFYHQEEKNIRYKIQDNKNQDQQAQQQFLSDEQDEQKYDNEVTEQLLKRIKSKQVNFDDFRMNLNQEDNIMTFPNRSHDFALNFLTKIYQLRMEILRINIKELELKQKPLQQDYVYIKNKIYTNVIKNENNQFLHKELSELAQIQYWFIKKRHYKAWRAIKKLQKIQQISILLKNINKKQKNLLRIYIKSYLRYQQIYYNSQLISKRNDISQNQVANLVNYAIKDQAILLDSTNLQVKRQFISQLKASLKILDRIEKVQILRQQIDQNEEQKRSLESANMYKTIKQKNQFPQLDGKLKIYRIENLGTVMMKKFIITCPQRNLRSIEDKLKILRKLGLNNIHIQLKGLQTIQMVVDQVQSQFDSYPKLVKYLIETYYRVISFCQNWLEFQLYPILTKKDYHIQRKSNNFYSLKINPYEGILFNILLSYGELKNSGKYVYPKHPFVAFSDQLKNQFEYNIIQNLQTCDNDTTAEEFGFNHLLEQMKSISLQNNPKDISLVVQKILKCPYFWSYTDEFFELVEFKERYQSMVNVEQCRRKQNERIRNSLTEQQQKTFTFNPLHAKYLKSYGYSKTVQMYFSIEGIMQKQAFLEDIGNFRDQGDFIDFSPQTYYWAIDKHSKEKKQINKLIKMTAQKQKNKRMNVEEAYYKLVFPSFHSQIRNLRNLLSHYTYVKKQKKQYSLEYKLSLIQKSFPKLFVFIYRWKPYLNKNFQEIKKQRIDLLLSVFKNQDKNEAINRLINIKVFRDNYKVFNYNQNLLKFFNYKQENRNNCRACQILLILMDKKKTIWDLIADYAEVNPNKKRSYAPYNYLFYEHQSFGCNGMKFLLPYFVNMVKRNKFTPEETSEINSSKSELMLQIEKLKLKIKNLQEIQNEGEDSFSEIDQKQQQQLQKLMIKIQKKQKQQKKNEQKQYLSREQYFNQYYQDMVQFDYVNKNTIYQLELQFPYLFDDLRRERYQWDMKARKFDKKQ